MVQKMTSKSSMIKVETPLAVSLPSLTFTTKVVTPLLRSGMLTPRDIVALSSTTKALLLAFNVQDIQLLSLPLVVSSPETVGYLEEYFAYQRFDITSARKNTPPRPGIHQRRASEKLRDRSSSPAPVKAKDDTEVKRRMTSWRFTSVVLKNDASSRAFLTLMSREASQASQTLRHTVTSMTIYRSTLDWKQLECFSKSLRVLTLVDVNGWPSKPQKNSDGLLTSLRELTIQNVDKLPLEPGVLASLSPKLESLDISCPSNLSGEVLSGLSDLRKLVIEGACNAIVEISSTKLRDVTFRNLTSKFEDDFGKLCRKLLIDQKGLRTFGLENMDFEKLPPIPSATGTINSLVLANNRKLLELDGLLHLSGLVTLDLRGCPSIKELPDLGQLASLVNINLSQCASLETLKALETCKKLQILDLSGALTLTSSSLGALSKVKTLKELNLSGCSKIDTLESLICENLVRLDVSGCVNLRSLNVRAKSLLLLNCSENTSLESLDSIDLCPLLTYLSVAGCSKLPTIAPVASLDFLIEFICSRSTLVGLGDVLRGCSALQSIVADHLSHLEMLDISGNPRKAIIAPLRSIQLRSCTGLRNVPSLAQLKRSLVKIEITGSLLESCSAFKELTGLKMLRLNSPNGLKDISDLAELRSLEELDLSGCEALSSIRALESCSALRWLKINNCPSLCGLPAFVDLPRLSKVELIGSEKMFQTNECLERVFDLLKVRRVIVQFQESEAKKWGGDPYEELLTDLEKKANEQPGPVSARFSTRSQAGNGNCTIC